MFYDIGLYDESFLMCEEEELMHRIKSKNNKHMKYLEMPLYDLKNAVEIYKCY